MKHKKFIFSVDNNNRGKVYINKKWLKDVFEINIHGVPWEYMIDVTQYKRNKGKLVIEKNEIATETKEYKIGKHYD